MSHTLAGAATALRQAGETVARSGATITTIDPGSTVFGAAGAGALGDLGRQLHSRWRAALDASARVASAQAARLDAAAEVVVRAAAGYADADEEIRRQLLQEW